MAAVSDRCGTCSAWLQPGATHCPTCQTPVAPAARARHAAASAGPLPPGSGLSRGQAPGAAPADRNLFAGEASFGDPFDDGLSSDLPLPELEVLPSRRSAPAAVVARPTPSADRSGPRSPEPAGGDPRPAHAPPAAAAQPPLDPRAQAELLRLAGYGSPPDGLLGTVPYAILVFNRRRQLRVKAGDARRLAQGAQSAAQQTLVALGRALLDHALQLDGAGLGQELDAARDAASASDERSADDARTQEGVAAELRAFDERIAALKAEVDPWRDRETKLATHHRVRDTDLKRAAARLHRIEIELRNLAGAGPGADPSRVALLEADRAARQGEVRLAEGPARELAEELAGVRRDLAARMAAVSQAESEKAQFEQAMRRAGDTRQVAVRAAESNLRAALIALGEAARGHDVDTAAGADLVRDADQALEHWAERERIELLHERALSAYDRTSFQRGAAILGGAVLIILVMFVLILVT